MLGFLLNDLLVAFTLLVAGWHWKLALARLLIAPIGTLLVLPFARWDATPSPDSNGQGSTVRGDLPTWARWFSTPDERLPGGTYEPAVAAVLARYGRFLCSWYWLGVRNRLQGLDAAFSRRLDGPWPLDPGSYRSGVSWWLRYPLFGNRLQFKAGDRAYRIRGEWRGVPCCTFTRP